MLFKVKAQRESLLILEDMPVIITKNQDMLKIIEKINGFAQNDSAVLICGEIGTGKSLAAKIVHYNSLRKGKAFCQLNGGFLTADVINCVMLKRTANSDIDKSIENRLNSADGGTLFLEEIANLDEKAQKLLLEYLISGSDSLDGRLNIRVIASTNREPLEIINFNKTLYDIFDKQSIWLPPLRKRREDIFPLAEYFSKKAQIKYNTEQKCFFDKAEDFLFKYNWPGNIEELKSTVKRSVLLSKGAVIEKDDILFNKPSDNTIHRFLEDKLDKYLKYMSKLENNNLYDTIINEVEKSLIMLALLETQNNQLKASKLLGINRNTLRSKIKKYNIL
ncbi:two component, sigma54 specific, transcriptional regulator, Fis family [Candidatus Magnetoovum chiemensis]|nr:two component, sigma54 specific, transcriptional regulator, Fis family [Candidatus Magnetoovum chiemensis]